MKSYLKIKDHVVSGEEFELLHHEDLDMLITKPRPEKLDGYYKSDTYISHTDSTKTWVDKLYQIVKKYSLNRKMGLIGQYVQDKKTLLDFGAGTGDFLGLAKRKGWEVYGVEPNEAARAKAGQKGVILVPEIPSGHTKKYQLITLWHVLEHLPDLEQQISALVERLGKGGALVIAVPNFKAFDAQYYKESWAAYDVPRHLWHFSRTSIEKLFARHDMKIVEVKPMVFDAFYVSLLSEKYKRGKQHYPMAFLNGLRSNIKAWGTGEYSSQIYILRRE